MLFNEAIDVKNSPKFKLKRVFIGEAEKMSIETE
jgi:hypothetical protein